MVSPEIPTDHIDSLRNQVAYMADDRELHVPDAYMRRFHQAFLPHLEAHDSFLIQAITENLHANPDKTMANMAHNVQRAGNDFQLRHEMPITGPWDSFFEMLKDSSAEQWHFTENLRYNVQTNVPDRGLLLKAAALLLGQTEPLKMLDVGCARHHISKKLAYADRSDIGQYQHVDVMRDTAAKQPNYLASHNFNRLIQQASLPIASSIGIDLQDLVVGESRRQAEKQRQWARSCFYPSEYLHGAARIREFDLWEAADLPEVKFYQGDIVNFDDDNFRYIYSGVSNYDIAYFSTVGYQLGRAGMNQAIDNVSQYLKKDGLVVVSDFAEVQPEGDLMFYQQWPKWSYGMFVLDVAQREAGFQKLFTVDGGRVGKLIVEEAAGKLTLARELQLT